MHVYKFDCHSVVSVFTPVNMHIMDGASCMGNIPL